MNIKHGLELVAIVGVLMALVVFAAATDSFMEKLMRRLDDWLLDHPRITLTLMIATMLLVVFFIGANT